MNTRITALFDDKATLIDTTNFLDTRDCRYRKVLCAPRSRGETMRKKQSVVENFSGETAGERYGRFELSYLALYYSIC